MSLSGFLLLSLLTAVLCGGCDFDREGVKNIKTTIDTNPTGFRTVFPKDYYVEHHYKSSMLCNTDPCCVFPAAVVLLHSWYALQKNLWREHLNHTFVSDLKQTLDTIVQKNKHTERFQEEMDFSRLPTVLSSPENLLKKTSELFSRWLEVGCSAALETCSLPTFAPPVVERIEYAPSRARLLTTRAVGGVEEGQWEKMLDMTQPPSNGGALSLPFTASVWSLFLYGLYWALLP